MALALGIINIGDYVEFSLSMEPILDSVHDPDPEVRKQAIQKLAHHRDPLSIQILHELLTDDDEEVRLYAATQIDHLEKQFQTRIYHLNHQIAAAGSDDKLTFELAKTYLEYTEVLMIHPSLKDFFLQKASLLLNQLIEKHPRNPDYYYYRGRARQLQEQYAAASFDFRKCLSLDPNRPNAYFRWAECMFHAGRFHRVHDILKNLPFKNEDAETNDAILFWTQPSKAI